MDIIETTVTGAALILAIVCIRAVALHKLPKTTFLVLWYTAALRLG